MGYFTLPLEKISDLEARYGTETVPVAIGEKTLQIVQVRDIDGLLKKQFSQEDFLADFPFWAKIWESAIILGHQLAHTKPEDGKEMLEIGAGLGVAGLFAAAFGHKVTISDYNEDALAFSALSAQLNQLQNVRFQVLDWCAPHLYKKYDYIIGSEILFNMKLAVPLSGLLEEALAPGGTILFAHDQSRISPGKLFKLIEHRFDIKSKMSTMRADDEEFHIVLHKLERK